MVSLMERVSRKLMRVKNSAYPPKTDEITRLLAMLDQSPQTGDGAQQWAEQMSAAIESNVLDRLLKKDLAMILAGLISYRNTGVTPQNSQIALMRAYENSNGAMQDLLHKALFPKFTDATAGVNSPLLGNYTGEQVAALLQELDQEGYVVLPTALSESFVDQLCNEALTFDYSLRDPAPEEKAQLIRKINPASPPHCVAAYAKSADLSKSAVFSSISADPLLQNLASHHLKTEAKAIDSTLWYSFAASSASAEAAQMYHYDLDTLRWLKVFVYLTDVNEANGPHEYVSASHHAGSKPNELMVREYARLSDDEVDQYCRTARKSITGKRGTVILGDTRCLHKGSSVKEGYRFIFSPIFAPSRIGYYHGT